MKQHFVTFASSDMPRTLERIKNEAVEVNCFQSLHCFTEKDLDQSFLGRFNDRLKFRSRGFGYWCWKPQVIKQVMELAQEGDVIVYCDAGCKITPGAAPIIQEYVQAALTSEDGLCVFVLDSKGVNSPAENDLFHNEKWAKEDLFQYFSISAGDEVRKQAQTCATIMVLRVCEPSRQIITSWLKVFHDDFALADDSASRLPNCQGFVENRHDQAIFSLLVANKKVARRSAFDLDLKPTQARPEGIFAARHKEFTRVSRKETTFEKLVKKIKRRWAAAVRRAR